MNIALARNNLGKRGEEAAARFLTSLGWENIRHNLRIRRFEIDICACKNGLYCLFEVKTRRNQASVNIISEKQKAHLRLAHSAFCENMHLPKIAVSYALIIINVNGEKASLEFFPRFL